MNSKYDQLSGRLADRLTTSPARGRAVVRDLDDATPAARPSAPRRAPRTASRPAPSPADERPAGSVRRGHLVPEELHRRARRRKIDVADGKMTWNDVMTDAVTLLVEHADPASVVTPSTQRDGRTRLVQVALPVELDRRFRTCYLDLDEGSGRRVTYEELWAAAIELWLER